MAPLELKFRYSLAKCHANYNYNQRTRHYMNISNICVFGAALAAASYAPAQSITEFFTEGDFGFGIRARYEFAEVDGADDSNALTVKTNLSYKFADQAGIGGYIDVADVSALDYGSYNAAGLNGTGGSVIADPETTEVKQAYLSYSNSGATAKLGRQRIIYDNARHIGNVGWRQDEQTYDAFSAAYKGGGFTLNYAYLWEINRIFGENLDWDSDTHLFNATYSGIENVKFGGYAYLYELDQFGPFDDGVETFGAYVDGKASLDSAVIGYRAEVATQDQDDDATYLHLYVDATVSGYTLGAGYEVLGAVDGVNSGTFATPLVTVHKFNGWADYSLPVGTAGFGGSGVEDFYIVFKTKIAGKVPFLAKYHNLESAAGDDFDGQEFDFSAAYKFNGHFTGLLKGAFFDGDSQPDVTRIWTQLQFTY